MRDIVLYITMWIVTITMYVSYVPQIYKFIKTKSLEIFQLIVGYYG